MSKTKLRDQSNMEENARNEWELCSDDHSKRERNESTANHATNHQQWFKSNQFNSDQEKHWAINESSLSVRAELLNRTIHKLDRDSVSGASVALWSQTKTWEKAGYSRDNGAMPKARIRESRQGRVLDCQPCRARDALFLKTGDHFVVEKLERDLPGSGDAF